MPYEIIKKPSGKFQVVNKNTGEIHAKGTTLKNAKSQIRLLEMVDRKKGGRRAYPEESSSESGSDSESDEEMEGGKRENLVEQIQDLIDKIELEGLPMSEGRAFYYNRKYRDIVRRVQNRFQTGENLPMNLIEPLLEEFAELIPHSELFLEGGNTASSPYDIIIGLIHRLKNEIDSEVNQYDIPVVRLRRYIQRLRIIKDQVARQLNNGRLNAEQEAEIIEDLTPIQDLIGNYNENILQGGAEAPEEETIHSKAQQLLDSILNNSGRIGLRQAYRYNLDLDDIRHAVQQVGWANLNENTRALIFRLNQTIPRSSRHEAGLGDIFSRGGALSGGNLVQAVNPKFLPFF